MKELTIHSLMWLALAILGSVFENKEFTGVMLVLTVISLTGVIIIREIKGH